MNESTQLNLGLLLLRGFRWFDEALRLRMTAAGGPRLTHSQSIVFAFLDPGGTRIADLARRIGVTRQAAQQTVAELVTLGLVKLSPDPSDRRARLVTATAEGRKSVALALDTFAAIERDLGARIGEQGVAALRAALEQDWGAPLEDS